MFAFFRRSKYPSLTIDEAVARYGPPGGVLFYAGPMSDVALGRLRAEWDATHIGRPRRDQHTLTDPPAGLA